MKNQIAIAFCFTATICVGWLAQTRGDDASTQSADSSAQPSSSFPTTADNTDDRDLVGTGTRGEHTSQSLSVYAGPIAPMQRGLTHLASPKLLFYLSSSTSLPIRVAIREDAPAGGIGETPLHWLSTARGPRELSAGLHIINLEDCKVRLKEHILYRWSVSIPLDLSDQSSQNPRWGRITYDPNATPNQSFYDRAAELYMNHLSNPDDPTSQAALDQLLKTEHFPFIRNLTESKPEPATLENPKEE